MGIGHWIVTKPQIFINEEEITDFILALTPK